MIDDLMILDLMILDLMIPDLRFLFPTGGDQSSCDSNEQENDEE